jgi:WD40 repeat protein
MAHPSHLSHKVLPKITDFGLARKLEGTTSLTQTGAVMGTPSYMAPEQAEGHKDVGPAADVWALGAILYELLTGRPAFRAATMMDTLMQVVSDAPLPPSRLRPEVPAELEALCLRCLEKDPRRRLPSARALAEELERFLARPATRAIRPTPWPPVSPLHVFTVAAVLALLGFAAIGVYYLDMRVAARATFPAAPVACLSPAGDLLLAAGAGEASLFDTYRGTAMRTFEHPADVTAAVFSRDGRLLALGSAAGEVVLYDLNGDARTLRFQAHDGPVRLLAFTADSAGLAVGTGEADAPAGAVRAVCWYDVQAARPGPIVTAAGLLAPDGRTLAEPAAASVRLWDTASGKVRRTLAAGDQAASLLAFSPDGRILAGTARPREAARKGAVPLGAVVKHEDVPGLGEVRLWDAWTGKERALLRGPSARVRKLLFRPDGRWLLTVPEKGDLLLWDTEAGGEEPEWTLRTRFVPQIVAITPDGRSLLAQSTHSWGRKGGGEPGSRIELSLLDAVTGKEQGSIVHDQMAPYGSGFLALSADGQTLLTRDWPGRQKDPVEEHLRVWDWAPLWRSIPGRHWLVLFGGLCLFAAFVVGMGAARDWLRKMSESAPHGPGRKKLLP